MSKTIFKDHSVHVVLSDHSSGAKNVAARLCETGELDDVMFVRTKDIVYGKGKMRKVREIIRAASGRMPSISFAAYDEILFYNLNNPWLYGIGDYSVRQGKDACWSRFDEGILSYDTDFSMGRLDRIVESLRCLTRKYSISNCVTRYYCYFPELKNNSQGWDIKKIPAINSSSKETIEILKHCFNYKEFPYPQKYIFFASSSDIDGQPFGETEMVLKLAEAVGTDNLLVKMHPRDTREIYRQYGISVMANSEIPWEVIQLCADMTDRVLLTVTSGSFLSVSAMSACDAKALFLVPDAIKETYLANRIQTIKEKLEGLHSSNHAMNVEITSFSEFCDHLKEMQEKDNKPSMVTTEEDGVHA